MTPHYTDDHVTLHHGDCLDVLAELDECSVDAIVTDPPYGLGFMGKEWDQPDQYGSKRRGGEDRPFSSGPVGKDHKTTRERSASMHAGEYDRSLTGLQSFQRWCEAWATECLRVLKPGGHLLAFGGSRTWHRLATGIEDAGFEVRDSIAWLYGSGFPKSMDVSKAIDKAAGATREVVGTAEYPGREGWTNGTGATPGPTYQLGMESAHLTKVVTAPATPEAEQWQGWGTALKPAFEPIVVARKPIRGTVAANVLEHGTGALNIDGCRVGTDRMGGYEVHSSLGRNTHEGGEHRNFVATMADGRWPANVVLDEDQAAALDKQSGIQRDGVAVNRNRSEDEQRSWYGTRKSQTGADVGYGGSGGASRFFTVIKEPGVPALPIDTLDSRFTYTAKADAGERITHNGVAHPTVKPLDLMRWLVRLVTPPGGTVLEPFAGSGTTVEAALLEGFHCIAIEREADYLPLITQRINRRRDPIAYLTASGEDLGLFEMKG